MRPFTKVASVLFSLVCLGHILRLVFGWEVLINGWRLPQWVSVAGAAVVGSLAALLWRESKNAQYAGQMSLKRK